MALFTQPCRAMVNDAEECIRLLLRPRLCLLGLINATYFIILRLAIFISNYDNKSLRVIKDAKSKIMFLVKPEQTPISQVLDIKNLVLRNFFHLFSWNIDARHQCNLVILLLIKCSNLVNFTQFLHIICPYKSKKFYSFYYSPLNLLGLE